MITLARTYNSNKIVFLRSLIAFICVFFSFLVNAQSSYVKTYRPIADSLGKLYGIPAAVILGVAIIESGGGNSRNCKLLNNHFGIVGKNDLLKTMGIKTRYKQYPNGAASYASFCALMSRKSFYTRLKGNMNHTSWLDAISRVGYSEAPIVWKQRVSAAIKKYKLADH